MSSAKGVREVGHVDCAGGGQIVVEKGIAYVGPHGEPARHLDRRRARPEEPRSSCAEISMPAGTHSHKARVSNGIMVVNHEAIRRAASRPPTGAAASASTT